MVHTSKSRRYIAVGGRAKSEESFGDPKFPAGFFHLPKAFSSFFLHIRDEFNADSVIFRDIFLIYLEQFSEFPEYLFCRADP